jgi:ribosomal protein L40E
MPDVIVLTEPTSVKLIPRYLPLSQAAVIPVIDASGERHCRGGADLRINVLNSFSLAEALLILKPVLDRVRASAESVLTSTDLRVTLLARLAVRARDMEPARDPSVRETIVYPDATTVPGATALAEELVGLGLLERQFFDKLITCPRCTSARLSVRERCRRCHSADLVEEALVHHLRCSNQGPEHDFRQGTDLICPKCRLHLEHFSVDYDRPGSVMFCRNCGHMSTDAAVSFICLDCDAAGDTDETETRVVWRYRLTEAGLAHVQSGVPISTRVRNSALDRLEAFVLREKAAERPFCVLAARLTQPAGLGERLWDQTLSLFSRLFRETFTPETEIIDGIVGGTPLFLALLSGDCKSEVECALPDIRIDLERHLSARLSINYAIFEPDQITRILAGLRHTRT